ncbi:MAG: glucosidase family protein [Saccharofermentanales bacterium]
MEKDFSIIWSRNPGKGRLEIHNAGTVRIISPSPTCCMTEGYCFDFSGSGTFRLDAVMDGCNTKPGQAATLIHVLGIKYPFSFFLRDVFVDTPIYIEEYEVVVTHREDDRNYQQVVDSIISKGCRSGLEILRDKKEASFDEATETTRNLRCLTVHGIARDIRLFQAGFTATNTPTDGCCWIEPRNGSSAVSKIHNHHTGRDIDYRYEYSVGRDMGCVNDIRRWNEEDVLPIINACYSDGDIRYYIKIFCSYEKSPLAAGTVKGTHYLVASKYLGYGANTEEQSRIADELTQQELFRDEETVAFLRIDAVNIADAPKYCFVKIPTPNVFIYPDIQLAEIRIDPDAGLGYYGSDEIFMTGTLDGEPIPSMEITKLIQPGQKARFEFKIPHSRIGVERAKALSEISFDGRLQECRKYWMDKLANAATIDLPEKRIQDMARTALLHFDLLTFGNEPDGPLAAAAGVTYNPIGSESSPIIQFYDSMGLHDIARRCIMFFLDKQQDDGNIHCYESYTLETGFVLWTAGEHYRYTRDLEWVESISGKLILACDYLIRWIRRNEKEELIGKGYGMIDGKVADPVDPYHGYMLNAGAYIGMCRCAEMLVSVDPVQAKRISGEADKLYRNIRNSLDDGFARAPLIPLGNGRWVPAISPWPEEIGALCLFADDRTIAPIGITCKDALLGTMYLLHLEVVEHDEVYGGFINKSHNELYTVHNTCFVQPYYSPHPYSNLRRGEVGAFLEEYYYNVSAHADRETYAFWEGYNHTSPYKSHEQAWFMMRTRWMLYLEEGNTLKLLPGIPRDWISSSLPIRLIGMKCYFGEFDLRVVPDIENGEVTVFFKLKQHMDSSLRKVMIRIPHPDRRKAISVSEGEYDPENETVCITENLDELTVCAKFKT